MNRTLHRLLYWEKLLYWQFASTQILPKFKMFILIHSASKFKQFSHDIIWIYIKCCLEEDNFTFLINLQFAVNSWRQLNISIPLALYIWILSQKTLYLIPINLRKLYCLTLEFLRLQKKMKKQMWLAWATVIVHQRSKKQVNAKSLQNLTFLVLECSFLLYFIIFF